MLANCNIFRKLTPVILVACLATGCASTSHFASDDSYSKLARLNGREPDPVIVIPGILGSRLVDGDTGRVVWGSFGPGAISHSSAAGRRAMALPMREGASLTSLEDGVRVDGTLDRLSLGFGLGVNAYARLLRSLAIGGYRDESFGKAPDEHFNCFQFGYDWRKSSVANASALDDFIEEKHRLVAEDYFRRHGVHKEIKFDIVAHSMGGLLARYYLMYGRAELNQDGRNQEVTWAGTRHVKRLIQVGTPNLGAAHALQQMQNGLGIIPLLTRVQPAVIGTFATPYELLPRNADHPLVDSAGKPIDLMDPAEWERYGWGLADPAQDVYLRQLLPDVPDVAPRAKTNCYPGEEIVAPKGVLPNGTLFLVLLL
ncbi:MAG: hypothetical protein O2960_25740 [Verrucomicrobia bacterium]|nr:hypothetical protein [Verrucomicrobiota bacterium]